MDRHISRNRRSSRPLRGINRHRGGRARDGLSIGRWIAVPLCIGGAIATLVCWSGVPLLRHDWGIPARSDALGPALQTLFQPWLLRGLGEPQPYPTAYLLGFALWPFSFAGSQVFTAVCVALAGALVAGGGAAIGRALDGGRICTIACALFAALNPWMYTELVAGHVFMVAAYGVLLMLAAEIVRPEPRIPRLVLWCALLTSQIEFLVVALVPMTIWLLRTRRRSPLFALWVACVPLIFGLAVHYQGVRNTPYLLQWQISQSVPILDAMLLRGYFTHYDASFGALRFLLWIVAAASALALVIAGQQRRFGSAAVITLGWLCIVATTGTKWIFAPLYAWAVLNVPETGVFRELYDLLAFAAVAFTVGIAITAGRNRIASAGAALLASALLIPWLTAPPFHWFVPQHLVAPVEFPGTAGERLALFPPVQPLSLRGGMGSGYDPDLFIQPRRAIPINAFFPGYPVANALALAQRGNFSALDALSVRYIVSRPYLQEDAGSIRHQILLGRYPLPPSQIRKDAYPMLGLVPGYPSVVTVGTSVDRNGIFFGDAAGQRDRFESVTAPRVSADPASAWVDARLSYFAYPHTATRFGGAFTSSPDALLHVGTLPFVLAWTNGKLLNERNEVIAVATPGLRWWPLHHAGVFLRCIGSCTVSATGGPPGDLQPEGAALRPAPVDFFMIAPWLVRASVPAHKDSTLRWASRYDASWAVLGGSGEHVRLDQDINAWLLRRGPAATVYLVNFFAAAQFVLEVASFVTIIGFLISAFRSDRIRRDARA